MKRMAVKSAESDYESSVQRYNEAVERRNSQKKAYDAQVDQYRTAKYGMEQKVKSNIEDIVRTASSSSFMQDVDVDVDISFYDGDYASDSYTSGSIVVSYGENRKFDDDMPLVWQWQFDLSAYGSKGEASRKTSSWSGLNATTAENISILKQSVNVLDALAAVDDEYIVNLIKSNSVNYHDYVTQEVENVDDSKYLEEQLETLVETGKYIKVDATPQYEQYIKLEKSTPKQFLVEWYVVRKPYSAYNYNTNKYDDYMSKMYIQDKSRMKKEKVYDMVRLPLTVKTEKEIESMMQEWDKDFLDSKED